MSFAALDDLLGPVVDTVLPDLPSPQRRALEVALLLAEAEDDRAIDARAVSVAVLSALRQLAGSTPLLVAVDDIQWLDAASAGVLAYAARRLHGLPVGLLLSHRTGEVTSRELENELASGGASSLTVGPLTTGALHKVVRERLGVVLTRPVLRRVHETSGGNPFYALEIARALQQEALVQTAGERLPVSSTLGELLRSRIEALPAEGRAALAVAAATSAPRLSVVSAALDADAVAALSPAVDAHVVTLEDEMGAVHSPAARRRRVLGGRRGCSSGRSQAARRRRRRCGRAGSSSRTRRRGAGRSSGECARGRGRTSPSPRSERGCGAVLRARPRA